MSDASAESEVSAAVSTLRKKRTIARVSVIFAMVLCAAVGFVVWMTLGSEDEVVPPVVDYQPVLDDEQEGQRDTSFAIPTADSGPTLVLGLDQQTGQISGELLMPDLSGASADYLAQDHKTAIEAAGGSGGGESVADGICGYTSACPQGLPRSFEDDLGIEWVANELGSLPRDSEVWHQARLDCYLSPRLIEDCNFELTVGGYGALERAGFDPDCLAEQYRTRMDSMLTPAPAAWWECEGQNWEPHFGQSGLRSACEQAFRPDPSIASPPTIPPAAEEDEAGAIPLPQAPATDARPDDSSDLIERCSSSATDDGQGFSMSPCEVARAVLAVAHPPAFEAVPPCGIAALPPPDTWTLRTIPPDLG